MTAASLVRPVLWLTVPAVRGAAHALWTEPGLRERYPGYLSAMHGLVCASVPLMEAAVEACGSLPAGDPAGRPLADYFAAHIAEERGHDDWLLEDLAVLGVTRPGALLDPAVREDIAALAGAQYYLVRHSHPACLLGYISVLEGCPPDAQVAGRLPLLTGWPAAAFRTLAQHAALDPGHEQELIDLLEILPLSPVVTAEVARNAAYTAVRAARLLRRLAGPPGGSR
ncbi:MAG TPA: iron-containing redox enzyme family protein [Streptosporangiaceae bacterium]|nr:iron-containing redox enzyme family protein [Streptosporangiaceae bacterium]